MKYKYLLFDLDGTLFDYDKAEIKALEKTFGVLGFHFKSYYLETYRNINKKLWEDFEKGLIIQAKLKIKRFEKLAEQLGLNFDGKKFSAKYLKHLSEGTDLIAGTLELLNALNGRIKLYLITNGLKEVQRHRIAASDIAGYFEDIIISEEVGTAKPAPQIFDAAFTMMGNPDKQEVMIIGDSLTSDITGGNNYGIDTCWFNPESVENNNYYKPTYEIKHLSDILRLVAAL